MSGRLERLRASRRLLKLSLWIVAGRRYWLWPLGVIAWPALQVFFVLVGWRQTTHDPVEAQNLVIGFPLTVLGIILGVRIIAGEIDRRTLEIAYTVPGGAQRVWFTKLIAALGVLLAALATLAVATVLFVTVFPVSALYGAFQSAVVYMVLATALAALFKSETSGILATVVVWIVNLVLTGFGQVQLRVSPMWNAFLLEQRDTDPATLLAWTVQNRIGMVLLVAALLWLAIGRAERREALLG